MYRDDAQVVDTFADARDRDILNLAEEMEHDLEADKLCLIEKETPWFCKLLSQTQFDMDATLTFFVVPCEKDTWFSLDIFFVKNVAQLVNNDAGN